MSMTVLGSTPYAPLHAYLKGRFADNLVLTFSQIEDLIGFTLPAAAYERTEWWTGLDDGGAPTPQSRAWTDAKRIPTPNLFARTVFFERAGT